MLYLFTFSKFQVERQPSSLSITIQHKLFLQLLLRYPRGKWREAILNPHNMTHKMKLGVSGQFPSPLILRGTCTQQYDIQAGIIIIMMSYQLKSPLCFVKFLSLIAMLRTLVNYVYFHQIQTYVAVLHVALSNNRISQGIVIEPAAFVLARVIYFCSTELRRLREFQLYYLTLSQYPGKSTSGYITPRLRVIRVFYYSYGSNFAGFVLAAVKLSQDLR